MERADHGGGIDAAVARWGGLRGDWLDLSTGINPRPYPVPDFGGDVWTALPDAAAFGALEAAARAFWRVPAGAAVLAAPGASALIARIPALVPAGRVAIAGPTYNEHGRAFRAGGWDVVDAGGAESGAPESDAPESGAVVVVHPNNPDGRLQAVPDAALRVLDESFCDVCPDESQIALADRAGVVVLKSFGKFWGLAGMRLGFAIGDPALVARLAAMVGPWAVSGPALRVGAAALTDQDWAQATRDRLAEDAARLDGLMLRAGAAVVGGTTLFRLYDVGDAAAWAERLARHRILGRVFPYSSRWLRLGLPDGAGWDRLEAAL